MLCDKKVSQVILIYLNPISSINLPTAGDIDRELVDPVGDGVGLIPWEFGVPGAGPPELSLLLPPLRSCKSRFNIFKRKCQLKLYCREYRTFKLLFAQYIFRLI